MVGRRGNTPRKLALASVSAQHEQLESHHGRESQHDDRSTEFDELFLSASGAISANTIQIIAPAARPRPTGSRGLNHSTKANAGAAISGCGRLVKMAQSAAFQTGVPRGTSTRAMARPSGIL